MKNVQLCFECSKPATEHHHIIPKSLGGIKTVPLCTLCHAKVHGLHNTTRADSSSELTKRGLDRHRAWYLFAVYQAIEIYQLVDTQEIINFLKSNFDVDYSIDKVKRLKSRLNEMDPTYLNNYFDEHIGKDMSHIWNEDRAELYLTTQIDTITTFVQKENIDLINQLTPVQMKSMFLDMQKSFLEKLETSKN